MTFLMPLCFIGLSKGDSGKKCEKIAVLKIACKLGRFTFHRNDRIVVSWERLFFSGINLSLVCSFEKRERSVSILFLSFCLTLESWLFQTARK